MSRYHSNDSRYWAEKQKFESGLRRIWLAVKIIFVISIICFVRWKYVCHRAYSEYTGETANRGFLSKVFDKLPGEK